MRQAGRYMPSYQKLRAKHAFKSLCYDPALITEVTHLPVDELGVDAAIVFSDILLLLEPFGGQVRFEEGIGPLIDASVFSMEHPPHVVSDKIFIHFEFLKRAIKSLTATLSVPLIGFAGAPFTLASYLIEGKSSKTLSKTKLMAWENREGFKKLIDQLTEGVASLLKLQIEAGCQIVQLFDSWADFLPEADFSAWCLGPLKKLVDRLAPTKVPLIYFCRGSSYRANQIATTGVHAISLDSLNPVEKIRKELLALPLQGNLPPEALFLKPDTLASFIDKQLMPMAKDPAYIFNLGHGVLPETPYENVKLLVSKITSS